MPCPCQWDWFPEQLEVAEVSTWSKHVLESLLNWLRIDGLHDFQGKLLHSANWDQSVDYEGKNVAVIGTGSSASTFYYS